MASDRQGDDLLAEFRDVVICILAGGSGTRLWPLSRQDHPKQLLSLTSERSLLQQTIDRVAPLVSAERIYILTGPDLAPLIREHLPAVPPENVLVEPAPRGTAPALGMAAARLRRSLPGSTVMVSLHADHEIARVDRFRVALRAAVATARRGHLVTIGIVPDYPETGFGYIERGDALVDDVHGHAAYRIARFREKPPLEQAKSYVESGCCYWNTGYFAWTLDRILEEFARHLPETHEKLQEIASAIGTPKEEEAMGRIWDKIEKVTIDVGIMEKAQDAAVVPGDLGWSDVGSWASLFDILPHDEDDNVHLGEGTHVALDTQRCLIYGNGRLIATVGLSDMIVVDTGDALLVLPRERAQDVSALVQELRARGLNRHL